MKCNTKAELLCEAYRRTTALSSGFNVGAKILNHKTDGDLEEILRLAVKLGGKIMFFSKEGEIFALSPLMYQNRLCAGAILGPFKCGDWAKLQCCAELLRLTVSGLYYELTPFVGASPFSENYFLELESRLLININLKNQTELSRTLKDLLYDAVYRLPTGFASSKAFALSAFVLIFNICEKTELNKKTVFGNVSAFLNELKNAKYETETLLKQMTDGLLYAVFGKTSQKRLAAFEALKIINLHFNEKLTLSGVAEKIYISPHYLSKAFKDELSESFSMCLNRIRTEKAKILLKNDEKELKEIALAVGYDDQSYFSKVFKKLTGYSPKQYKLKCNAQNAEP